ncbi:MAG: GHKL domain-containing protein [Eubacteriales bacterium]|nr:GHKL domain-containing protein [Eubacteriales bacterium]
MTVRAKRMGSRMLAITVDNTCPHLPILQDGRFLSSKHKGFGNGTESVRSIAEKYEGDARFEWKDGIFYASVMLNP